MYHLLAGSTGAVTRTVTRCHGKYYQKFKELSPWQSPSNRFCKLRRCTRMRNVEKKIHIKVNTQEQRSSSFCKIALNRFSPT